jgi:hypothetical protein
LIGVDVTTSAAQWQSLLMGCEGSLAVTWLAVHEIALEASVHSWDVPKVPKDVPFGKRAICDLSTGQLSILHWHADAETQPLQLRDCSVFYCIMDGEFVLQKWRQVDEELVLLGERRGRAPDVLHCADGHFYSMRTTTGGVTLVIRSVRTARRVSGDAPSLSS